MKFRTSHALLFILVSPVFGACARQDVSPQPPNIIIITMDTVRADHCSVYGYDRDTTPYLKKLASEGARFTRAYAPTGATAPSHATLFTSKYTVEHGLVKNGQILDPYNTTLAEILSEDGYQTAAIVSSFVLDAKFGLDRGFAHYDDVFNAVEATIDIPKWEGRTLEQPFDRRVTTPPTVPSSGYPYKERSPSSFSFTFSTPTFPTNP